MKTIDEISTDKLRGGFYTPPSLVEICLDHVARLTQGHGDLSILEPSAGDGAFVRLLCKHFLARRVRDFLSVEILESEAQKCCDLGTMCPFPTRVFNASVLDWAGETDEVFDAVVGNPPFVRFQFLSSDDLRAINRLGQRMNVTFRGVGNLWIPVLLSALGRLRAGGVMSLVLPSEIFTGLSAGDVRSWLLERFDELRVDLFEPGSFPEVLQEVVVVSGRRRADTSFEAQSSPIEFVEHGALNLQLRWMHHVSRTTTSWTRYLLTGKQLACLEEARRFRDMHTFGYVAKLEVSIVTGANDYFSVNTQECEQFQLQQWAEPLLPRTRHAEGLIYDHADHQKMSAAGVKAWLLNFCENRPDPRFTPASAAYVMAGEQEELHTRYKTSIRTPWYRVPGVWAGQLLLSKRSHWFPRLIQNEADVVTTDTIYRGSMRPFHTGREKDLVASFHNSLTLLTAEIEGRSFGGGVLELVPSEVSRLTVPLPQGAASVLPALDATARGIAPGQNGEKMIQQTNDQLSYRIPEFTTEVWSVLEDARRTLLERRLSRN